MSSSVVVSPVTLSKFAHSDVPKPNALVLDDVNVVDPVRRRFSPKPGLFSRLRDRTSKRSLRKEAQDSPKDLEDVSEPAAQAFDDTDSIHLNSSLSLVPESDRDHYEWAVVYENQRGITIFSTPYYSSQSLLPIDPSPFTLPNASKRRSEQPPITLDNYPLPDGNWRWVSRCWMIDMRSDSGEVQHDGFEYNWIFRKHNWRAEVGAFSAGGWVRRRRWIRLMVRSSGKPHRHDVDHDHSSTPSSHQTSSQKARHRQSVGSSLLPTSVLSASTTVSSRWKDMNPDDVWLGDSIEADWERCHQFMKRFGRDGRKLEVWRLWLGYYHPEYKDQFTVEDAKGKRREKQWTEDEGPLPSEMAALEMFSKDSVALAPREYLIPVLRKYGQRILRSFIYPDSRAEFLKLLALADLLQELDIPFGKALETAELDFYSYANTLQKKGIPTK
ncbi:hypothetical protein CC1G_06715 [Coprinopsis cinerea okayama7|uniref:TECPR1-like DysF domain-containing protein n=1 Tax=Coprinopsis cinerea (strain Okayama-7 / 130 / ATCC MYA-4618 / FGSC 9003) TaxID=240176 RepID=A8N1N5_COPC7|nr:hypothetical protein CC1G_06715 [Coprinopsis cinerea okayama7\|eukprot:XP_001828729.2 hypothetical protein CC1G_06715 [Coprinopsis cinerea okayama7\